MDEEVVFEETAKEGLTEEDLEVWLGQTAGWLRAVGVGGPGCSILMGAHTPPPHPTALTAQKWPQEGSRVAAGL